MRRVLPTGVSVLGLVVCISGLCQAPIVQPPNGPGAAPPKKGKSAPAIAPGKGGAGLIPIVLNYHPVHGEMVVDGLVNGNNPAQFVIATGLNHSTVSPEDVARFELKPGDKQQKVTFLDISCEGPIASVKSIRLGAGTVQNLDVTQASLWPLLTKEYTGDLPGCWLGADWLSHFQVMLDFEQHSIILSRPDSPFIKSAGSAIVPFKMKAGRPVVKINAGAAGTFEAVLDTASMGTLIPSAGAQKLKGKKGTTAPSGVNDVAGGKMVRVIVPSIALGKAQVKNLMAVSLGPNAKAGSDKTMAVIGQDFMRHFRIIISFTRQQIQILPPASQDKPEEPGT